MIHLLHIVRQTPSYIEVVRDYKRVSRLKAAPALVSLPVCCHLSLHEKNDLTTTLQLCSQPTIAAHEKYDERDSHVHLQGSARGNV